MLPIRRSALIAAVCLFALAQAALSAPTDPDQASSTPEAGLTSAAATEPASSSSTTEPSTTASSTTTTSPATSSTSSAPNESGGAGETSANNGSHSAQMHSNFTCYGRQIGYYADVSTECKIYHFCVLGDYNGEPVYQRISYFCLNETLFDQQALDCVAKISAPCTDSEKYYDESNKVLRQAVHSTNSNSTTTNQ